MGVEGAAGGEEDSIDKGNYDDGVNAIRVTLAADESFKTGRPVSLA